VSLNIYIYGELVYIYMVSLNTYIYIYV